MIVTRNHGLDLTCARAVLPRKSRYVGLMGSARKSRMLVKQLHEEGFDPARIDALFTPVGMNIDAETPAELAISILAEIVAVRHNSKIVATLKDAHAARRAAASDLRVGRGCLPPVHPSPPFGSAQRRGNLVLDNLSEREQ